MKYIKRYNQIISVLSVTIFLISCNQTKVVHKEIPASKINEVVNEMIKVMVHDVTNPPLGSRFFAYSTLAGYEVISQNDTPFQSMRGVLNNYPFINKPAITDCSYQAAALFSMIGVAAKLQPSGILLDSIKNGFIRYLKENEFSEKEIASSQAYATTIIDSILSYAKRDGYRNISNYKRYTPEKGDGFWSPTPPAYMAALEPNFNKVSTFYTDAVGACKPSSPIQFNTNVQSSFYKMMDSVYKESKSLNTEHRAIANFWDCNPFSMLDDGHLQIGIKKISPGAHWMGITSIACTKANTSFDSALLIHTLIATGMMDAFITCWNEKYRSNRVRPETVIRKYLDVSWQPLLQTPPFPEYPSGHSVVSSCSAEILTWFFGNSFSYTDDVEKPYGLPSRNFTSFKSAAAEAAISRFYGGIHFMDAIVNGQVTGNDVGKLVITKFSKQYINEQ